MKLRTQDKNERGKDKSALRLRFSKDVPFILGAEGQGGGWPVD